MEHHAKEKERYRDEDQISDYSVEFCYKALFKRKHELVHSQP